MVRDDNECMPHDKTLALVVRASDFSETSRIATLWTREFGKVRILAKGGRRLKSSFECSLDLLALIDIVVIRKSGTALDLLTEARGVETFSQLRTDLQALYAGYYVAELLGDWTEVHDPHPALFDAAVEVLRDLGQPHVLCGARLLSFELVFLRELGYGPALIHCAACTGPIGIRGGSFSAAAGGMVCQACEARHKDKRPLSAEAWRIMTALQDPSFTWGTTQGPSPRIDLSDAKLRGELRQVVNDYVTYVMGRRPRLQPYLGS